MTEKYFNEDGVYLTSTQMYADGKAYNLAEIESVYYRSFQSNYTFALASTIIGLLLLLDGGPMFPIGGITLLIGLFVAFSAKTKHAIIIRMPDGDKKAVMRVNREFIERAMKALDFAMANRSTSDINKSDNNIDISSMSPPAIG